MESKYQKQMENIVVLGKDEKGGHYYRQEPYINNKAE